MGTVLAVRSALLGLVLAVSACGSASTGASGPISTTPGHPRSTVSTTSSPAGASRRATSGGLSVILTAERAATSPGAAVTFVVRAQEIHAPGALSYQVLYGDGSSDQAAAPALCQPGPGGPAQQTWTLTHAYAGAGRYAPSVTVRAGCTPDRATATVTVVVG